METKKNMLFLSDKCFSRQSKHRVQLPDSLQLVFYKASCKVWNGMEWNRGMELWNGMELVFGMKCEMEILSYTFSVKVTNVISFDICCVITLALMFTSRYFNERDPFHR